VGLVHRYDQSGVAVAGVPTRSPRPPWFAGPPEAAVTVVPPMSPELTEALLVGAAAMTPAMTPPEAECPQWEDDVLPS
jgi:hypothetical protein